MKVIELYVKGINGIEKRDFIECDKYGIVQDKNYKLDNKVSILIKSEYSKEEMCRKRFKANIIIDSLEKDIRGKEIRIGDAIFLVENSVKECKFKECRVKPTECMLKKYSFFSKCVKGGTIKIEQDVKD